MTDHYTLMKMYRKKQNITVDTLTFIAFSEGKRDNIIHLLDGVGIPFKPPVKEYGHYVQSVPFLYNMYQNFEKSQLEDFLKIYEESYGGGR